MDFYENIRDWYIQFYEKNEITQMDKANISHFYTMLNLMYDLLEIKNKNIEEIINLINIDNKKIEKYFYDTFLKLKESKSKSTIKVSSSICRKIFNDLGIDKTKLITPAYKENKNNSEPDPDDEILKSINYLKINRDLHDFIIKRYNNIKYHSRCKTKQTHKILMRYWINILKSFGDLKTINFNELDLNIDNVVATVKPVIINNYYIIYLHHLFYQVNDTWNIKLKELKKYFDIKDIKADEVDGDKDTLSPKQQEDIIKNCQDTLEKVVCLLLLTTGMRVGGLSNIKKNDVYNFEENKVKDYGVTLEKGNKTRNFPIFDIVKPHIKKWIDDNHMYESEYLFPNRNNHNKPRTTMFFQTLFKDIAQRAGYTGKEIHIHSARHSVAHNLLEAGNSLDDIGRFLGHANPATTAKFYTKLSIKENIERMNTACIGGNNFKDTRIPQVPNFNFNENKKQKKHNSSIRDKIKKMEIDGVSMEEYLLEKKLEKIRNKKLAEK